MLNPTEILMNKAENKHSESCRIESHVSFNRDIYRSHPSAAKQEGIMKMKKKKKMAFTNGILKIKYCKISDLE